MSDDSYVKRQAAADEAYKRAYAEWVSGLSPFERLNLKCKGVEHPEIDHKATGRGFDGVELGRVGLNGLGSEPQYDAVENEESLQSAESVDLAVKQEAMRLVRIVMACIFNPSPGRTVAYEVDIVGVALGVPGLHSITAVAAKHGFGKQAISKAARKFCDDNELPPSIYMRSEENREIHRKANRRRGKA